MQDLPSHVTSFLMGDCLCLARVDMSLLFCYSTLAPSNLGAHTLQMLLLVHWSILAYTGLVKILKKHYKRTGLRVQAPHLDNLLSQPFCSVEVGFRPPYMM